MVPRGDFDRAWALAVVREVLDRFVREGPSADDVSKGLSLRPLGPEGEALWEEAWSGFTAG